MDTSSSAASASTSADASTSAPSSSLTTSKKAAATTGTTPEHHTNGQTGANGGPIACNGCQQSLEETSDTVVVSFGEGLWHVDCRCAKCNNLVEHDTNLLLLADGSPVCEGCSYVCSYCNQSISNEAIVTGDESYHADCFRCKACSTRIEELVFAKTSQGIYCMACHNERVARTRKHAESKRNRSLRRNQRQGSSGQASSSRSRNGAGSSTSVNTEHNSKTSTPQASDSSFRHENRHLAANGSSSSSGLHSPLTDSESVPNSASLATTGHLQAGLRRGSADADASTSLPEPPTSLKKLRGMDKSPRLGDKETLHPKGPDHANMHTSPRRGQEALYMSPSASSEKDLPVIDGITERSDSNSSIDKHGRQLEPSETTSGKSNPPALNIPRSTSPSPSARTASPVMPASSPTNFHFTQLHGGLTAPRANASRNPNRRSGFYGAMAMPAGATSPTGSGSVTPVLQEEEQAENGYFAKSDANDAEQDAGSSQEDVSSADKALPVRPLAINRNQGHTDRNGIGGTPSSSLSSVNTSGAGSTSSLSIPSTDSHTPQTLSASSSAGKNNHLSFYDPDVLVFLDAVNDGPGTQRRAPTSSLSADRTEQDASSLSTPTKEHDSGRHSGKSLSSTAAQDGYDSDTPDTTLRDHSDLNDLQIRSRSLSPNPEQRYSLTPSPRQPRDLNLVANGHISTFSASTNEEDEEREMLSPLNSRRQSSGANGLGLSTTGSQRSNKSNFGTFDDEEDEDDATKTALRRVRESIRQSRGASISSAIGESPSGIGSGMTLDIDLVELLIKELEETKNRMKELQKNYNAIRRASRQAFEGFSMAREEYDREVQARREAEFEMLKLKKELQEQASKLSALNQAQAQQEQLQRQSRDLRSSVVDIEQELRKMKIQRELTYAEMEELAANAKSGPDIADLPDRLSVALDNRLSSVKETYRQELEALSEERDTLQEEVEELRQARDLFTDEGNELNKRNAELSDDLSDARKQLEAVKAATAIAQNQLTAFKEQAGLLQQHLHSPNPASPAPKQRTKALPPPSRSDSVPQQKALSNLSSSVPSSSSTLRPGPTPGPITRSETPPHVMAPIEAQSATIVQKIDHVAPHATVRKFKWGSKKGLERPLNASISKHPAASSQRSNALELSARQHNFQPISILRPVRCESCGDKMWGMGEQRCQACGIYCHSKCAPTFNIICNSAVVVEEPDNRPGAMSIFGNDLVAQCLTENRLVPTVVDKCIEVVEATAIQYEGIYRKSGGMGQTKLISSCFDRGEPFDLGDQDRFNDISAVTSVLKNYFRNLPNPLYTFEFHQDFCSLPSIKESDVRLAKLEDLLHSLPEQHYATLRTLMLHLNRIHRASSENKMTPANLGVVFGPTLLRSPDPSQEFSQMHLKARVVELTVENAQQLFEES